MTVFKTKFNTLHDGSICDYCREPAAHIHQSLIGGDVATVCTTHRMTRIQMDNAHSLALAATLKAMRGGAA